MPTLCSQYQCCGVDGPSNYRQGSAIPWSCFARAGDATAAFDPKSTNFATSAALKINQIGCLEVLSNLMRRHLLFGALGSLCSAILQVGLAWNDRNTTCFILTDISLLSVVSRQFLHPATDHAARSQTAHRPRSVQDGHAATTQTRPRPAETAGRTTARP